MGCLVWPLGFVWRAKERNSDLAKKRDKATAAMEGLTGRVMLWLVSWVAGFLFGTWSGFAINLSYLSNRHSKSQRGQRGHPLISLRSKRFAGGAMLAMVSTAMLPEAFRGEERGRRPQGYDIFAATH